MIPLGLKKAILEELYGPSQTVGYDNKAAPNLQDYQTVGHN